MAENQKITNDYILEKIREAKINEKQLSYEEATKNLKEYRVDNIVKIIYKEVCHE